MGIKRRVGIKNGQEVKHGCNVYYHNVNCSYNESWLFVAVTKKDYGPYLTAAQYWALVEVARLVRKADLLPYWNGNLIRIQMRIGDLVWYIKEVLFWENEHH